MQDGNIHCHVDNLARRNGRAGERIAVATAAYNAGERLWSDREQRYVDFGNREDVVFSKILVPKGSPVWVSERALLWNKVDLSARRRDARLAKSIVAAVTRDIPPGMRPALLEAFVTPFLALGCVADIAIHEDGTGHNPHVHVLLTTRRLSPDGFGDKIVALEQRAFVKSVRKHWADLTNSFLEQTGSALRVDHRSYKARGIGAEPTLHRGPNATERRRKREHARRVREEKSMAEPDALDKQHYPLLTQRETWPPEPEASPGMSREERDEHHRYWQDKKLDRLEEAALIEPERNGERPSIDELLAENPPSEQEWKDITAAFDAQPRHPKPAWWTQALDNARRNQDHERNVRPIMNYNEHVLDRARAMASTRSEWEALEASSPEQRPLIANFILQERIRALREQDRADELARMPPDLRRKLEALRPEVERERDYPVPGPDGELLSPEERNRAEERMLEEYRRDEPERDRDR